MFYGKIMSEVIEIMSKYIYNYSFIEKRYEVIDMSRRDYDFDIFTNEVVNVESRNNAEEIGFYMTDNELDIRCFYYDTNLDKEIQMCKVSENYKNKMKDWEEVILIFCLQNSDIPKKSQRFVVIGHSKIYDKEKGILYYGEPVRKIATIVNTSSKSERKKEL